ncbi:MAG: hypothetical protein QMD50_00510 [Patescibacteria group bacterium]|nr:hypothetical protein [Patescibacteria group bacterium]
MAGKLKTTKKGLYDLDEEELDPEKETPSFHQNNDEEDEHLDDDLLNPTSPHPYEEENDKFAKEDLDE